MKIYKHLVSQGSRVWYRLGSVSLLISVFIRFVTMLRGVNRGQVDFDYAYTPEHCF